MNVKLIVSLVIGIGMTVSTAVTAACVDNVVSVHRNTGKPADFDNTDCCDVATAPARSIDPVGADRCRRLQRSLRAARRRPWRPR